MVNREIHVLRNIGMDNGLAAQLVETANRFDCDIKICYHSYAVNAKSLLGTLNMCLRPGLDILLTANGQDEEVAANMLEAILTGKHLQ